MEKIQISEIDYSSIKPGKNIKEVFSVSDLEEQILKSFGDKILPHINLYNKYSTSSNSAVLRDLFKNLEDYFKSKKIDDDDKKVVIAKVFETIKNQIQILETIQPDNNIPELVIILYSTVFTHFKRLLS